MSCKKFFENIVHGISSFCFGYDDSAFFNAIPSPSFEITPKTSMKELVDYIWSMHSEWDDAHKDLLCYNLDINLVLTAEDYVGLHAEDKDVIPLKARDAFDDLTVDITIITFKSKAPKIVQRTGVILISGILPMLFLVVISYSVDIPSSMVPYCFFVYGPYITGDIIDYFYEAYSFSERHRSTTPVLCAQLMAMVILVSVSFAEMNANTGLLTLGLMLPPPLITVTVAYMKRVLPVVIIMSQAFQIILTLIIYLDPLTRQI